jgi:hypothetical protein
MTLARCQRLDEDARPVPLFSGRGPLPGQREENRVPAGKHLWACGELVVAGLDDSLAWGASVSHTKPDDAGSALPHDDPIRAPTHAERRLGSTNHRRRATP